MVYWDCNVKAGLRSGNFCIFRILPLAADRHWSSPDQFYNYLLSNHRHRRELLAVVAKWKDTVYKFFVYHHTLVLHLPLDPCLTDEELVLLLKGRLGQLVPPPRTCSCDHLNLPTPPF